MEQEKKMKEWEWGWSMLMIMIKKKTQKVYIFGLQQCCKHPTTLSGAREGGTTTRRWRKKELLSIPFDSLLITTANDLLRLNSCALSSSSSASSCSAPPVRFSIPQTVIGAGDFEINNVAIHFVKELNIMHAFARWISTQGKIKWSGFEFGLGLVSLHGQSYSCETCTLCRLFFSLSLTLRLPFARLFFFFQVRLIYLWTFRFVTGFRQLIENGVRV